MRRVVTATSFPLILARTPGTGVCGLVAVRDVTRNRTRLVRKGERYFAARDIARRS